MMGLLWTTHRLKAQLGQPPAMRLLECCPAAAGAFFAGAIVYKHARPSSETEAAMALRVAINGFGRIGRNILRAIIESGRNDIEVIAINDLGPVETNAHLLRFDSVHGRFPHEVGVEGDSLVVDGRRIRVTAIKNPAELPHKELGVDIAMECTGIFTSKDKAK